VTKLFLKFEKTEIFSMYVPFFGNGEIFIGLGYNLVMISKTKFLQTFLAYDRNVSTIFLLTLNQTNVKIYQLQVKISIDVDIFEKLFLE
jgi:hypothetical protein